MKLKFLFFTFIVNSFCSNAQSKDSVFIAKIYSEALKSGESYENLRYLCKEIGARLSGSAEAEMAVMWSETKLKDYNFDTVYLQEIKVPHWERGTSESAWIKDQNGRIKKLQTLALGGSVGTNGLMKSQLIIVNSIAELQQLSETEVRDKIVFINQRMPDGVIESFTAYGACFPIRRNGAVESAKLGAKAVLIRSLSLGENDFPHTGTLKYNDSVNKIPAAAISTNDADYLNSLMQNGETLELFLEMDCKNFPDVVSHNVIAEIWGKKRNNIITFGGHLDSWDVGDGAHDDGAGIVQSIESIRILRKLNYQPENTLRCVLFMNEENGNRGGETYALIAKQNNENHIAAIESDRGGFAPRGFEYEGDIGKLKNADELIEILEHFGLSIFRKGHGGVDIDPLKDYFQDILLFGFLPDSQRYFDIHHSANDVFENVNKRELELGSAAICAWLYLIDNNL